MSRAISPVIERLQIILQYVLGFKAGRKTGISTPSSGLP
jgi:hypothetical protein